MTQRALGLGLAVLCAGLVTVVAAELSIGAGGAAEEPVSERAEPRTIAVPVRQDIDGLVSEILERPLFAPSRLPYEAAVEAEEDVLEDEPQVLRSRLTGVMIRPEGREALFEGGSKPVAVKEGGQVDGRIVKSIRADRVILSSDAGEEVLRPVHAPAGPQTRLRVANGAAPAQAQRTGAAPSRNEAPTIRDPRSAAGPRQDKK